MRGGDEQDREMERALAARDQRKLLAALEAGVVVVHFNNALGKRCRLRATRNAEMVGRSVNHVQINNSVAVFCVVTRAWRTVNLDRLIRWRVDEAG